MTLVCLATLMLVWDRSLQPPLLLYITYVPVELAVGIWLLVTGSRVRREHADATAARTR